MKSVATGEYGNTFRSRWKGYSDGVNNAGYYPHEFKQLGKGITESHSIEENRLFNTKEQVTTLLEGLLHNNERNEDENETQ